MPTSAIDFQPSASVPATNHQRGLPRAAVFCPSYGMPDQRAVNQLKIRTRQSRDILRTHIYASARTVSGAGRWPGIQVRQRDLSTAWHRCQWLWPARGGYGCRDLLPALHELSASGRAPGLIGYSDLTTWHCFWRTQGWGETLYAFMPATAHGPLARESLRQAVRGGSLRYSMNVVGPNQSCSGWSFAACLRVLASLCGARILPDLSGSLLFLEDIDERPYAIDRDLTQLHAAGVLAGVQGMIWGCFPHEEIHARAMTLDDLATKWSNKLSIPIWHQAPFGHHSDPLTIPIGRQVTITC